MKSARTKKLIITGMFAALTAVLAQVSIPLPSGVPITLQTFAVALTGVVLGGKLGLAATFVYILLGAVGVPVFTGFQGGLPVIAGKTGGFIWGFLFLAFLSGAGLGLCRRALGWVPGMAGLVICHILGTAQFALLAGMDFTKAALLVSLPYLAKDVISVALAWVLGLQIRTRLARTADLP